MGAVNKPGDNSATFRVLGGAVAVALCFCPFTALAQDTADDLLDIALSPNEGAVPLLISEHAVDLAFDTAGSEHRKFELQLSEPLLLNADSSTRWLDAGSESILATAGINWLLSDSLQIGASVEQQASEFTPFGSIQCENGILGADSFRASNCTFTNLPTESTLQSARIGAELAIGDNALTAINLFRSESHSGSAARLATGNAGLLDNRLMNPIVTAPFAGELVQGVLPQFAESAITGVDLEFQLGFSTDNAGEMQLGLQFTRVFDAQFDGLYPRHHGQSHWTLAEPVDSARLSFDWHRNSFSGGVQGFFREPMSFLNESEQDGVAMFDVYFSWRTPWNASLSVGASNLLNNKGEDTAAPKNNIIDPFESIYGRIPYVRYKQDL